MSPRRLLHAAATVQLTGFSRIAVTCVLIAAAIPCGLAGLIKNYTGLLLIRFFVGIAGASFVPCLTWCTLFYDKVSLDLPPPQNTAHCTYVPHRELSVLPTVSQLVSYNRESNYPGCAVLTTCPFRLG